MNSSSLQALSLQKVKRVKFEDLAQLGGVNDYHWANHHFEEAVL